MEDNTLAFLDSIAGDISNNDIMNGPKYYKPKSPAWSLIKEKILKTNELIMEATKNSNLNQKLEKELLCLKSDNQDVKKKFNLQFEKAMKLELDKSEFERKYKECKEILDKQQIKINEDKRHIVQLQCKIKEEEDKSKTLQQIIDSPKPKVTRKKAQPKVNQECQTICVKNKDFSVNTDPIELNFCKASTKDFSANVDLTKCISPKPIMKDASVLTNPVKLSLAKPQMKDFTSNVNFTISVPKKPQMVDKNEWTNKCIEKVSNELFPIFCSKCSDRVSPAPVDQILKIMTTPPPLPLSSVQSPPNSPQMPRSKKRRVDSDLDEIHDDKMNIELIPSIDDDQYAGPLLKAKRQECSAVKKVEKLEKKIFKLEKTIKTIKSIKNKDKSNDSSNQNCCSKNIQLYVNYPDRHQQPEESVKPIKKSLKRLHHTTFRGKKNYRHSVSNKWQVDDLKPKRVKVLCPKSRKSLKKKLASQIKTDYLFKSQEVSRQVKTNVPYLIEKSSSDMSCTSSNEEESISLFEKPLENVVVSNSIVSENKVLGDSTSQISLYKFTYPNNIEQEKSFNKKLVTNVCVEKNSLTRKDNLSVNKECKKNDVKVIVNEQSFDPDNSSVALFDKRDDVNTDSVEHIHVNNQEVSNLTKSKNSVSFNSNENNNTINEKIDKNITEKEVMNTNSEENSFSDILSYPIVFGDSRVSRNLNVTNTNVEVLTSDSNKHMPNITPVFEKKENLVCPISEDKSKDKCDESIVVSEILDNSSNERDTTSNEIPCKLPVSNNINTNVKNDVPISISTLCDLPNNSGLSINSENLLPSNDFENVKSNNLINKSVQNLVDMTDDFKIDSPTSSPLASHPNSIENLCAPGSPNNDRISQHLSIKQPERPETLPCQMHNTPNNLSISVQPENTTIVPVSSDSDANVSFTEQNNIINKALDNLVENADDFKKNDSTLIPFSQTNLNDTEDICAPPSPDDEKIAHHLSSKQPEIQKLSCLLNDVSNNDKTVHQLSSTSLKKPRLSCLVPNPRTRIRIKGNKLVEIKHDSANLNNDSYKKLCYTEFSSDFASTNNSKENTCKQKSGEAINKPKNKSNVKVFVIPENMLGNLVSRDNIKVASESIKKEKLSIKSENVGENYVSSCSPTIVNNEEIKKENDVLQYTATAENNEVKKETCGENEDDFKELDFQKIHSLPLMSSSQLEETNEADENVFDQIKEIVTSQIEPNFNKREVESSLTVESNNSMEIIEEIYDIEVDNKHEIDYDPLPLFEKEIEVFPLNKTTKNESIDVKTVNPAVIDSSEKICDKNFVSDQEKSSMNLKIKSESPNELLNETSESIFKPQTIKCEISSDETETKELVENSFKLPKKPGRKRSANSEIVKPKLKSRLLSKLRNLKKDSKISMVIPNIKSEPCVSETSMEPDRMIIKTELDESIVKKEFCSPIIKSEEIISKPITIVEKPLESPLKSVLTTRIADDRIPDYVPTKKQRIAHTRKHDAESQSVASSRLVQKTIKSEAVKNEPNEVMNEVEKFDKILENIGQNSKERAEFSKLQKKETNSFNVNLRNSGKNNSRSIPSLVHETLPNIKNIKAEPDSSVFVYKDLDYVTDDTGINTPDVNTVRKTEVIEYEDNILLTSQKHFTSPVRALRSRQVIIEDTAVSPKAKKSLASAFKQRSKSRKVILPRIDQTNSCLNDSNIVYLLNETFFSETNTGAQKLRKNFGYTKKIENFIYEHLTVLMETEPWTSEITEKIAEKITNAYDYKTIALYFIEFVSENNIILEDEVLDLKNSPPAPIMTKCEQKIVLLAVKINSHFPEFIDKVLEGIQYKLFRLGQSPQLPTAKRFVRLVIAFNKIKKNRENVRITVCDILYCWKGGIVELVDVILRNWHEVLPHYSPDNDIIVKTIVHVIMTLKVEKHCVKLINLRKSLISLYGYPNDGYVDIALFEELVNSLKENIAGTSKAILLFCKKKEEQRCGFIKAIKNIIIEDKFNPNIYETLNLLGNIIRTFSPSNPNKLIDMTILQLIDVLKAEREKGTIHLQEGIISCLSSISKLNFEKITEALLTWKSEEELRPYTKTRLISYFKSYDATWWKTYIRSHFSLPAEVKHEK